MAFTEFSFSFSLFSLLESILSSFISFLTIFDFLFCIFLGAQLGPTISFLVISSFSFSQSKNSTQLSGTDLELSRYFK